jgi:hypothetical protein
MDFKKITGGLVLLGGSVSAIGPYLGQKFGELVGTPRDACGWQYVQATTQLHSWILGTAVPLLNNEKVKVYLGDCSRPDPWMFAMLCAIPGVILFV